MFLAETSPRSYIGLYQKFLYKSFSLLLTPSPPVMLLTPHPMQRNMRLGQVAQCSMLLKNLRPYTVVSAHLPNALPKQGLDDLHVTHQSQVTRRGLSHEAVFFSSTNFHGETFHCAKRFKVVQE